jgi:amino acid transporter
MPKTLLLTQALLVSLLSLLFVFMPSVSSAFWILSALVTQLYLIVYVLLFGAALKLRKTKPDVKRPYKIPTWGLWSLCSLGVLSSLGTFFISFFPPSQIKSGNSLFYVFFLLGGILVACTLPSVILFFQHPSWKKSVP